MAVAKNIHNHYRGLHIVIINHLNGKVEVAKVFDTSKSSVEFEHFTAFRIPEGHIVVAACMDDCVTSLSPRSKEWFRQMGSEQITKLEYR